MKSHDAPRVFDDNEGTRSLLFDAVEVVEELSFRQSGRELPFSETLDILRVKATSSIANGLSFGVVKSDTDAALEETSPSVKTSFKVVCCVGKDGLLQEEIDIDVEEDPVAEGFEGTGAGIVDRRERVSELWRWAGIGERVEVVGDLAIAAVVELMNKLDDITAGVTGGEAMPKVFGSGDDESATTVTAVDGTGADDSVRRYVHLLEKSSMSEDLLDGDDVLEMTELKVFGNHDCVGVISAFPFPGDVRVFGKGKRETPSAWSW